MIAILRICKCLLGATLGSLPGLAFFAWQNPRIGVAVVGIGALVGGLLALPGVSVSRTIKLFLATMLSYNVPGVSDRAMKWVDDGSSDLPESKTFSDAFTHWICGKDIVERRVRIVLTALVIGLIFGISLSIWDSATISSGKRGFVLPFKNSNDSLLGQAAMLTLASGIWTAAVTGIIATPAFRRPILFGVVFAGFLGGMIGYAADNGNGPGAIEFAVFLSSFAAASAILFAAVWE